MYVMEFVQAQIWIPANTAGGGMRARAEIIQKQLQEDTISSQLVFKEDMN
jgi:hypothetical protein